MLSLNIKLAKERHNEKDLLSKFSKGLPCYVHKFVISVRWKF